MNVLYDFQCFSLQAYGGVSRYFLSLWREFARQTEPKVHVHLGVTKTAMQSQFPASVRIEGWTLRTVHGFRFRWLCWMVNTLALARQLRRIRPDVYHPTYYWTPPSGHNGVTALTVHDLTHELLPQYFCRKDFVYRWRSSSLRRADLILAVSNNTKRDLCRVYGVPEESVVVTPLAGSLDRPKLCGTPSRGMRTSVLYVGDRGGYKNFELLATVWKECDWLRKSFRLCCFGGGTPGVKERELPGVVEFLSGDDAALERAYESAAVLVYPSLYEGFGLPVVEAFQCGCPVLTSGQGSLREVGGSASLEFDPKSPSSLESALRGVLLDDEVWNRMQRAGELRGALYSWENCAKATIEAYRQALARVQGKQKAVARGA